MSGRVVQQYTQEFKESAVKLAKESHCIAQTARDLGLKNSTLYTWLNKDSESRVPIKADEADLRAELKRLKKEVAEVTMERDILKKAAAYFAKQTL